MRVNHVIAHNYLCAPNYCINYTYLEERAGVDFVFGELWAESYIATCLV